MSVSSHDNLSSAFTESSSIFADLTAGENPSQPIYTYILVDIRSNAVLDEVNFKSVTFSNVLSGVGDFSGTISVNPETSVINIRGNTTPGHTALYVLRGGELVWGGIIWKRVFSSDSRTLQINAKTFESYFNKRLQLTTKYWASEDQLSIARWLVESNGSAAAVGIEVSTATSPRFRERTMFGYEFKTSGLELEQLANLIDGFDWNVLLSQDPDSLEIRRKLEFFYPERGLPKSVSTLLFEYPGVVKSFSLNEDAENGGNKIWAIGTGEGTEQVVAFSEDRDSLDAGYPLNEETRSYKSVVRPSTLQSHADADLGRLNTPVTVFEVTLRADIEPELGTYNLGDWATFRFNDSYFYDEYSEISNDGFIEYVGPNQGGIFTKEARITQIEVSISDSGVEDVKLTLGGYEEKTEDKGID